MSNSIRAVVVVLAAGLLLGTAAPVAAQSKPIFLTAGYMFQRFSEDCDNCSENIPLGVSVDVAGDITPEFQWVGAFDWGHKSFEGDETVTLTFFGGGARYNFMTSGMVKPYVQALLGLDRFSDSVEGFGDFHETDFAFSADGGMSYDVNDKTAFIAQIGFRRVSSEGDSTNIVPRIVVGGRWRFGS